MNLEGLKLVIKSGQGYLFKNGKSANDQIDNVEGKIASKGFTRYGKEKIECAYYSVESSDSSVLWEFVIPIPYKKPEGKYIYVIDPKHCKGGR